MYLFLNFCSFCFCQYFCSFLIQEFFVDEKCFRSNSSWCDLKWLLKSFIVFLKGYSWLATVLTCHRSACIWNPFTEVQGSPFHAKCRENFSPHLVHCCWGGNFVVVHNSTLKRQLKCAIATWSSSGTFKNSECNCWHRNLSGSLTMPLSCVPDNLGCCRSFVLHPKS